MRNVHGRPIRIRLADRAARLLDPWIGRWAISAPANTTTSAASSPSATIAKAELVPATVVTGGSAGIGQAIAAEFAASGGAVVLVARDARRLDMTRVAVGQSPGARPDLIHAVSIDVTAADAARSIDAALAERGLYLDVLVCSAGIGLSGPFAGQPADDIGRLLALNVEATTRLVHHALQGLLARGRGGILVVSSLGAHVPGPNQAAYYGSKAYLSSLTAALAEENAGRGVRITVVSPGPVETGFHAAMGADRALYRRLIPAMSPERVARAAVIGFKLGWRTVIPGILPRVVGAVVGVIPVRMLSPIVRRLLR
jgi:short-subunit dehydrogenase